VSWFKLPRTIENYLVYYFKYDLKHEKSDFSSPLTFFAKKPFPAFARSTAIESSLEKYSIAVIGAFRTETESCCFFESFREDCSPYIVFLKN